MDQPTAPSLSQHRNPSLRLWPAWMILGIALTVIVAVQIQDARPFQYRNLFTLGTIVTTLPALLIWWMLGSGVRWRTRWKGLGWITLCAGFLAALFRIQGVTGDFVPIIAFRWSIPSQTLAPMTPSEASGTAKVARSDFPQFLGPTRDGQLARPLLATNWTTQPPRLLWRLI